jgi:hypothetical protein
MRRTAIGDTKTGGRFSYKKVVQNCDHENSTGV